MKSDTIIGAVEAVTAKWAKQRKAEERAASARSRRRQVMTYSRPASIRDVAFDVMEKAYLKASANGTLPAHARQIMYAARAEIQNRTCRPLDDQYFTQTLLPDYMELNGVDWNVVFDARGNFHEPHTKQHVPLGTLQVREYLAKVRNHAVGKPSFNFREARYPTLGPRNRFGAILFIEKEGFMPLFKEVKLAERYDLAIMSTKGMSVTAARSLVDTLCAKYNIPLLVIHDFDKAGFSIIGTLKRDTRRYQFTNRIKVVDLGLRLEDIDGLETEKIYSRESQNKVRANLRENGATDDEIEFLLKDRVELNAFASDELVSWVESKLDEHGTKKVIPDADEIDGAYRRVWKQAVVHRRIEEFLKDMQDDDVETPDDLADQIAKILADEPETTWDVAVRRIVEGVIEDGESAAG